VIVHPTLYEILLKKIKEANMPDSQEKTKGQEMNREWRPIGPFTNIISDAPEPLSWKFTGSLEEVDKKHFLLKLGCNSFVVHNTKEAVEHIERELEEWLMKRKKQYRASQHLKKKTQKLIKEAKKKASEKKLKPTPEEPSLIPEPEDPSSKALPPEGTMKD